VGLAGGDDADHPAEVHGYTVAFAWSAGIFALAAVVAALLLTSGVPQAERVAERERGIAA
jgi:hypothetical protein